MKAHDIVDGIVNHHQLKEALEEMVQAMQDSGAGSVECSRTGTVILLGVLVPFKFSILIGEHEDDETEDEDDLPLHCPGCDGDHL